MKTIIISIIISLLYHLALPAQEIQEESIPLNANQKVVLNLKFAEDIKVENWNKDELLVKAEVEINNNSLNHAHTMDVANKGNTVIIETGFNEELIRTSNERDCNGKNTHQNNFNGKDGYSICSSLKYTVYLPSNTDLTIESISGNITLANRKGPVEAKSISGFVDFSSPANQKADFYLKSISGEVYSDLDIELINQKENPIVGYELKGKLNGGGEKVRLESISGDIYVRKEGVQ